MTNISSTPTNIVNVVVSQNSTPRVVTVQANTTKGPPGESPSISVYNATVVMPINHVLTIDASKASSIYVILTQDITDFVITGWPPASKTQRIAVYFQQDTTGNRVIHKWPDNTKWSNGQAPDMSMHVGAIDCLIFDTFNNGITIFGSLVGQDYS